MTDFDAERRACELLQWVPYSLPSHFDEGLAAEGYYTKIQRQRSDAALDAWEKANPSETNPELEAFHELERLGVFSQVDFYSPSKAKNDYYTKRLRAHLRQLDQRGDSRGATQPRSAARPHPRRRRAH